MILAYHISALWHVWKCNFPMNYNVCVSVCPKNTYFLNVLLFKFCLLLLLLKKHPLTPPPSPSTWRWWSLFTKILKEYFSFYKGDVWSATNLVCLQYITFYIVCILSKKITIRKAYHDRVYDTSSKLCPPAPPPHQLLPGGLNHLFRLILYHLQWHGKSFLTFCFSFIAWMKKL